MITILGIDIGTTSVKVNCTRFDNPNNCSTYRVLQRTALAYRNHLESVQFKKLNKDNLNDLVQVGKINSYLVLSTLVFCIEQIDEQWRQEVDAIGIAGQMHGVCYWNRDSIDRITANGVDLDLSFNFNLNFNGDYSDAISDLITWEDDRCDNAFLDQLPDNANRSCRHAYTGYAVATTFWYQKNEPDHLSKYSSMGSIMDFVINLLCPSLKHPVTSRQLAYSYGYFDMKTNNWSSHLNRDFPKHLLPIVVDENQLAGRLECKFCEIKMNVPVFVACGDLQSAIYCAMLDKTRTAILNSGTSMQLAFPVNRNELERIQTSSASANFENLCADRKKTYLLVHKFENDLKHFSNLDVVPYFGDDFLITCSSLNGGNVLAFFVQSIAKFLTDLFDDINIELSETELWTRISRLAKKYADQKGYDENETLKIEPRLFGERSEDIKSKFSISSISTENFELGRLYYTLCSSLIDNVFTMCPVELLKKCKIETICSVGSTISKNEILKDCLTRKLNKSGLELLFSDNVEADLGISAITMKHFYLLSQTE